MTIHEYADILFEFGFEKSKIFLRHYESNDDMGGIITTYDPQEIVIVARAIRGEEYYLVYDKITRTEQELRDAIAEARETYRSFIPEPEPIPLINQDLSESTYSGDSWSMLAQLIGWEE